MATIHGVAPSLAELFEQHQLPICGNTIRSVEINVRTLTIASVAHAMISKTGKLVHVPTLAPGLDRLSDMLDVYGYAATLDLFARALSETMPIGDFSAEKEREPADAEIRILISQNQRDIESGAISRARRANADAAVASADVQ